MLFSDSPNPTYCGEAPFTFEELFFSRTDSRGIIRAGNKIFQRVSMFEWEEMLGKPHNVVRHADMPKGLFWLFWDHLKRGEPIGAYVKNRTKDGRYYWVFAVATPMTDGFLSVRLKPSSPLLGAIKQTYAELLAEEREAGLSPQKSAQSLLRRLAAHGFADYQAFMAQALAKEIRARDAHLGRAQDASISALLEIEGHTQTLLTHADAIFATYESNAYVPLNLQVQSIHLGDKGAGMGVIFKDYSILSEEIKTMMGQFMASTRTVAQTIRHGLFMSCTAKIQRELVSYFDQETEDNHIDRTQEMAHLETQQRSYQAKVNEGIRAIAACIRQFQQDCASMKRLTMGLEVTRVMGKVESARLTDDGSGLSELIGDLGVFQSTLSGALKEIEGLNRRISESMAGLSISTKTAA